MEKAGKKISAKKIETEMRALKDEYNRLIILTGTFYKLKEIKQKLHQLENELKLLNNPV